MTDSLPSFPSKRAEGLNGSLVAPVICLTRETWSNHNGVGIDWLTLFVDVPDDFPDVSDGVLERIDGNGETQWTVRPAVKVRGSWEAGVHVKTESRINEPGRRLKIDGNPTKFFLGHNVIPAPSHNVQGLCRIYTSAVCASLGVPIPNGKQRITRIDVTAMCPLSSKEEADCVLKALADQSTTAYRGRATKVQHTVYFGSKSSQYWSGKAYLKSIEIASRSKGHRLDDALGALLIQRLKAWAEPCIRIEFQLRAKELERHNLNDPANYEPHTVQSLYMNYADRVHINQPAYLDHNALASLKAGEQRTYLAWHSGHQLALPKATFYRHRASILKVTGVDVAVPRAAKEQAVRLQKVIQLRPTAPPAWAFDHIRLAA